MRFLAPVLYSFVLRCDACRLCEDFGGYPIDLACRHRAEINPAAQRIDGDRIEAIAVRNDFAFWRAQRKRFSVDHQRHIAGHQPWVTLQ
ncbi:hypothetical protein D3C87_1506190 [compost metagenome]